MLATPALALLLIRAAAAAQAPAQPTAPTVTHPTVTVTAQKEPADPQSLPVSVTLVPLDSLWNGGMTTIGEASIFSPNTYFSDFSARKLSNPRVRGIGSSPANPAVTTYIDGVPQLNTNSSSIEFLDVNQVEFVRGPQSALFGRNTLGGLVNVSTARPSLSKWAGSAVVPFGNYSSFDVRANASGPLGKKAGVGFAIGHARRDGFTKNDVTGHDLDSRDATFGKAQLLLTPTANWEARLIYTGERARDGDYSLMDLGSIRDNPRHAARDFEGHTNRDVNAVTFLARREGTRLTFTSTTGYVRWKTDDDTDLDYTPLPLFTRTNAEKDGQFTQEFRFASRPAGALKLSDAASLKWQAGLFLFSQNYDQLAVNTYSPFVLVPVNFPIHERSEAALDDTGVGLYGTATVTFDRLDLSAGARFDREDRDGLLSTYLLELTTVVAPTKQEKTYSNVSPQVSVAYHVRPDAMAYFSVTKGFKAGGFNPVSITGGETYDEEHTWNFEGGLKSAFAGRRVTANIALFSIDWQDLQLNLPIPGAPGRFYISNIGSARSSGVEFELNGRPRDDLDLFATFGYDSAHFGDNTSSSGSDVSDNRIPFTPKYASSFGAQFTRPITSALRLYGRGELVVYGSFKYDDLNLGQQDAYSLANFRAGARARNVFVEGWLRNAFDTHYVPVAFAYNNQLARSGFLGESGRPRTFGVTAGVGF